MRALVLLAGFFLVSMNAFSSETWGPLVAPGDPRIAWAGRIDFSAPEAAVFDWAQTGFSLRFSGDALQLVLDPGDNNLDLRIDGELKAIIGPLPRDKNLPNIKLWMLPESTGPRVWSLSGLKNGAHAFTLAKRTGANFGPARFYGLRLDKNGKLEKPSAPLKRRLEFIGDSLPNGYGCAGAAKVCAELRPFENSGRSYAALCGAELSAEIQVLALSGFGVVRNYGDKEKRSKDPLPFYYGRTLQGNPGSLWDRSKFKPDAVILFLGSNDYSTEPNPDPKEFYHGFDGLVDQAMKDRKGTPLFVVNLRGRKVQETAVQEAFQRTKARGLDVTLVTFENAEDHEFGCDWHPKAVVHERWAKTLEAALKSKLGW
ncbi:MAG: GDSL-type esterase/lipase family protein [candidate division FCPU426 bacterium]